MRSTLFAIVFLASALPAWPDALHQAVKRGAMHEVERLVRSGSDVTEIAYPGGTPLHVAALEGNLEIAEFLLASGAAVNATEFSKDETPLHQAALGGHSDVISLLVRYGAEIDAQADKKFTPLHKAIYFGKSDAAIRLIELGADVKATTQFGFTPLHLAGVAGLADVMALLRERGAMPPDPTPIEQLLPTADPYRGERLFDEFGCASCHASRGVGSVNGPDLWNVVGREMASATGFKYSAALSSHDGRWTYANLNHLLADAQGFFPGTSMVTYGDLIAIPDAKDRADLIAYLRVLADKPKPLP